MMVMLSSKSRKLTGSNKKSTNEVRVLIVDDSKLIRKSLKETLDSIPGIKVVGTASNGVLALEKIRKLSPDVVTLDFHMPRLNGLETLKRIMKEKPLPVIMLSSATTRGAKLTLEALRVGAVDFLPKPTGSLVENVEFIKTYLVPKIFSASESNPKKFKEKPKEKIKQNTLPRFRRSTYKSPDQSIFFAIGCSTGGPRALEEIVKNLPRNFPAPIGVVQHMPEPFLSVYAEHLNNVSRLKVKVASKDSVFRPGTLLLAPGNAHMRLVRFGKNLLVSLQELGTQGLGHFPSVDLFFCSVAKSTKSGTVGIILSGMGKDGTSGFRAIKMVGGLTVAQDKASAIVYGMPGSARSEGLVDVIGRPYEIAKLMTKMASGDFPLDQGHRSYRKIRVASATNSQG